jgi:hypothetical protein
MNIGVCVRMALFPSKEYIQLPVVVQKTIVIKNSTVAANGKIG